MFPRLELVLVMVWFLFCWGNPAVNRNPTGKSTQESNPQPPTESQASPSEPYSLRLVGGDSRCRGELEVQRLGQDWIGVDPWYFPLRLGHRVCTELDCGSALAARRKPVSNREAFLVFPNACENASLGLCFVHRFFRTDESVELNCSDSVRLVGGQSLCSGSLQIQDQSLDQSWAGVCEGALDRRGAEVLCRELGCGAPLLKEAPLLQGELSPLGQTFHCEGHESAVMDCPRNQTRTHPGTCSTLRLTCSEPLRLVGGASRCEGTVEMKYRGEWRRLIVFSEHWNLETMAGVCRDLDCGSAVSADERRGFNGSAVWVARASCAKKTSVRDCVFASFSGYDVGMQTLCSGHQGPPEDTEQPGVKEPPSP